MPIGHAGLVSVTMNDTDLGVVARNAILLLTAFTVKDKGQAAECMIHVWYSAMLTKEHIELLHELHGMISEVCDNIKGGPSGASHGKTWAFGRGSLRLALTKEAWSSLLSYFDNTRKVSSKQAQELRTRVTMAKERKDHRERSLIRFPAARRICALRFREDGVLLPFGHSRHPFDQPNP